MVKIFLGGFGPFSAKKCFGFCDGSHLRLACMNQHHQEAHMNQNPMLEHTYKLLNWLMKCFKSKAPSRGGPQCSIVVHSTLPFFIFRVHFARWKAEHCMQFFCSARHPHYFLFVALLDFEFRAIDSSGFRSTRSITRAPLCLCVIFSFPYVCAQSSEFSTLCFFSSKGPSVRYFKFVQRARYLESGKNLDEIFFELRR